MTQHQKHIESELNRIATLYGLEVVAELMVKYPNKTASEIESIILNWRD